MYITMVITANSFHSLEVELTIIFVTSMQIILCTLPLSFRHVHFTSHMNNSYLHLIYNMSSTAKTELKDT